MGDCLADAEAIFRAGLDRVDPLAMMQRVLAVSGDILRVTTETECHEYDLSRFKRIFVLGAGKASARMALGLERLLGGRIAGGVVAVKEGYLERLARITLMEAAHPVPDGRGVAAARAVLAMAGQAGPDDLVIVLLSGGGSAILAAPIEIPGRHLTLADKQQTTRVLLGCGATIHEINCVRKKLSAVKGGRLARAIAPAHCLALLLSDVVGDDLDVIASGPTVPDPTNGADALAVCDRYGVADLIAPNALTILGDVAAGRVPDTPKAGDPAFAATRTVLVGANFQALLAARDKARDLGYATLVLTSHLTGESREMANLFLGMARYLAQNDAYHYFEAVGRLLKTGPTNTNVCDVKVLLVP